MATNTQPEDSRQTLSSEQDNQLAEGGVFAGYEGGEEMPLGSFAALVGLYGAAFVGFLLALDRSGRKLPEQVAIKDLLLLGVATHKVSRLLTKDWVTAPLRAPFATYQGTAGAGEVKEKTRGRGMQRALGALFT